tara:strand:- start:1126 stop:2862 length:1737 start_codon:yes stop_codon:yes gene_type:complete
MVKAKVKPKDIEKRLVEGVRLQEFIGDKINIEDPRGRSMSMIALESDSERAVSNLMLMQADDNFNKELFLKDRDNSNCLHYAAKLGFNSFWRKIFHINETEELYGELEKAKTEVENLTTKQEFNPDTEKEAELKVELEEKKKEWLSLEDDKKLMETQIREAYLEELAFVNDLGKSPISILVDSNSPCLKDLFLYCPGIGEIRINSAGDNLLLYCIKKNRKAIFETIISLDSNRLSPKSLGFTNYEGITPMMQSALDRKQGAYYCKKLLNAGVKASFEKEMGALVMAGLSQNDEVIKAFLSLGDMFMKRESKLINFLKDKGLKAACLFIKTVCVSADIALKVTSGANLGLSKVGDHVSDTITNIFGKETEGKEIKKSFEYIEKVKVELNWIENINYKCQLMELFPYLSGIFANKSMLFKEELEEFQDSIDKTPHIVSLNKCVEKILSTIKREVELYEDKLENIQNELSVIKDKLSKNVVNLQSYPTLCGILTNEPGGLPSYIVDDMIVERSKICFGSYLKKYNKNLELMSNLVSNIEKRINYLSNNWSELSYSALDTDLTECGSEINQMAEKLFDKIKQ